MSKKTKTSRKMIRFNKSDRMLHWTIALPFIVCFITSMILVFYYNPDPERPFRDIFSWTHRISGASIVILPLIVIIFSKYGFKAFVININQAWAWTIKDYKWFFFLALSFMSKRINLPEEGRLNTSVMKYNYASAMILMSTYPFYILSGILIWLTKSAFLFWIIHLSMAVLAAPLLLGHVLMSSISPTSRVAISGQLSGFVDRQYMKQNSKGMHEEVVESVVFPPVTEEIILQKQYVKEERSRE